MRACVGFVVALLFGLAPLGAQEKPAEKPAASGGPNVEVQFADGSLVKLTLLDPKLDVVTRYGRLSVPIDEVRRIELGLRYPDGALAKIQDAIARLGDADFKKREQASAELLAFRELAYPLVRRAAQAGSPEAMKRAKALLEELRVRIPEDKLGLKDQDTVTTADFPIAGSIQAATFKARSPLLGDVEVKLVQARSIRWLGHTNEISLTVDAAKHGLPQQEQWLDSGLDISGDKVQISASGTVDVMPQNPGQFMASPDGLRVDVGFRNGGGMPRVGQPGALVGRIGNGQPFLVGSKYEGTPGEGRLFLRLEPSPWRVAMSGTFAVKIVTGK